MNVINTQVVLCFVGLVGIIFGICLLSITGWFSIKKEQIILEIFHSRSLGDSSDFFSCLFKSVIFGGLISSVLVFSLAYLSPVLDNRGVFSFYDDLKKCGVISTKGDYKFGNPIVRSYWLQIFWVAFPAFSVSMFLMDIYLLVGRLRKKAEIEKLRAASSKEDRTDIFRKNYVAQNKDKILKDTGRIKERRDAIILNVKKTKYYHEHVSPEVVAMWNEEHLLWEMASGLYEQKKDEYNNKKQGILERKRAERELQIDMKVDDAFGRVEARQRIRERFDEKITTILRGRLYEDLSEKEQQDIDDLKDEKQDALDRI